MTIFQINNKWFIENENSMQEIDYNIVLQWQLEGMEMLVEEGEMYV